MTSTDTPFSDLERTSELEPLLTNGDVCELFGISKPTLYRLIRSGDLVPIRVSRSLRFRPTDIRAYLERHREEVPDLRSSPRRLG
jgi:excisionase family DNA binding protein